jgi:hypothetical protein
MEMFYVNLFGPGNVFEYVYQERNLLSPLFSLSLLAVFDRRTPFFLNADKVGKFGWSFARKPLTAEEQQLKEDLAAEESVRQRFADDWRACELKQGQAGDANRDRLEAAFALHDVQFLHNANRANLAEAVRVWHCWPSLVLQRRHPWHVVLRTN